MAFIKSALEIALERTKDVKSDPKTVKKDELLKAGRKLASEYLFTLNFDITKMKTRINQYKGEDRATFLNGIIKTFIANINLPKNNLYEDMLNKISDGLGELSSNKKDTVKMIDQIKQFYVQYLESKEQLIEAIKQQYAPRLMQKQKELAEKYGQDVNIPPEQDPEFMEILRSNIQKLETQYHESLAGAKEELRKIMS